MINPIRAHFSRLTEKDEEWVTEHGIGYLIPCRCGIPQGAYSQLGAVNLVGPKLNIIEVKCTECGRRVYGFHSNEVEKKWAEGKTTEEPDPLDNMVFWMNTTIWFFIGMVAGAAICNFGM